MILLFAAVFASDLALLAAIVAVKWSGRARLLREDFVAVTVFALLLTAGASSGSWGAAVSASLGAALYLGLWLDAVLYRLFTIELGPGGLAGVVLSTMLREISGLTHGRRFFGAHRAFALLPVAMIMSHAALLTGGAVVWPVALVLPALGLSLAVRVRAPRSSAPGVRRTRSALRDFLTSRPLPAPASFTPRPEHAKLLSLAPMNHNKRSARFGSLGGADVLLLTFESLALDHLAALSPKGGGARAPFVESLLERAVRSRLHFSPSPTTNNAHLALYASGYTNRGGFSALAALEKDAGYQSVYLSAFPTAHFGLRSLLSDAGFNRVIDAGDLGGPRADDYALLTAAIEELASARTKGPLFLHVHSTLTHVPYRVIDRARYSRFSHDDDRGRLMNGIEETDAIFAELVRRLIDRGLVRDPPLIVISSDHGQSFGHGGYWSHGSAIVREQVNVPLLLHHPRLAPEDVEWSTHFDVLPTILDLAGVIDERPTFGRSVFADSPREPCLVLWAGHPSRTATSNFGVITGKDTKYMIDLATGESWVMDWNDGDARTLAGGDHEYVTALGAEVFRRLGLE